MPHWTGCLTKQEITAMEPVVLVPAVAAKVDEISQIIIGMQADKKLTSRRVDLFMVVPQDTVKVFKNDLAYTVDSTTTGQPPGMERINFIQW